MDILVAAQGFITQDKQGQTVHVYLGDTAHADHWLVANHPGLFHPINVRFPAEPKAAGKSKKADADK